MKIKEIYRLYQYYLNEIINILITIAGFVIFIHHKASRAVLVTALILWLLSGNYKEKAALIFKHKLVLTFVVFVGLFFLGMLWTDNFYAGRKIIERPLLFLIAPIMLTAYKPKYLKLFFWSMMGAIIFTGILTLLIKLGIAHYPYSVGKAPFVHRVYLAGMLVFAYSYFIYKIDFSNLKKLSNIVWLLLVLLMIYTLIVSGSRMGLINLFVATFIIAVYKFRLGLKKIALLSVSIALFATALYFVSPKVNMQVHRTINVLKTMDLRAQIFEHETERRTSLTCRFEFWYYAWTLGKKHPLLGVGTGDGIDELGKLIGKKEEKQLFKQCLGNGSGQFNPHNMYLFMFMQFGILGVGVLLWMLYIQLKTAFESRNPVFISLIVTTVLTLFALSELFTTRYFIPFYGYAVTLMYLFYLEQQKGGSV